MPAPTLTPTLIRQTKVLLVTPAGADTQVQLDLHQALDELVAQSGLEVKAQAGVSEEDLSSGVRMVVALPPDPGIAALAEKYSNIQFLAIGIPGLQATANLNLIGPQGYRQDQQAFLAGYIGAIVTPDWRAGLLVEPGSPAIDAFRNGLRFFCGLCRPAFPPFIPNPQVAEITNPQDQASWQASIDLLVNQGVQTFYVTASVSSPELLTYIAESRSNLIGASMPTAGLSDSWVATVRPDPAAALRLLWPRLLEGQGGQQVDLPLQVSDVNPAKLGTARLRLVQQTLDDLIHDRINPNPVPEP